MEGKEVGWDANGAPVLEVPSSIEKYGTAVMAAQFRRVMNVFDRGLGLPTYGELKQRLARAERKRDRMHSQIGRLRSAQTRGFRHLCALQAENDRLRRHIGSIEHKYGVAKGVYGETVMISALRKEIATWKARAIAYGYPDYDTPKVALQVREAKTAAQEAVELAEELCRTIEDGKKKALDANTRGDASDPAATGSGEKAGV